LSIHQSIQSPNNQAINQSTDQPIFRSTTSSIKMQFIALIIAAMVAVASAASGFEKRSCVASKSLKQFEAMDSIS
jgi:hypothetical protein